MPERAQGNSLKHMTVLPCARRVYRAEQRGGGYASVPRNSSRRLIESRHQAARRLSERSPSGCEAAASGYLQQSRAAGSAVAAAGLERFRASGRNPRRAPLGVLAGILRQLGLDSTLTLIVVPMIGISPTLLICAGVYWSLAAGELSVRAALAGGVVAAVLLAVTPTAAGYYLRFVAGTTPVELFLILAGILFTCFLAALGLLLGAGICARVQLGQRLGAATSPGAGGT
jgi:hypothetical protein